MVKGGVVIVVIRTAVIEMSQPTGQRRRRPPVGFHLPQRNADGGAAVTVNRRRRLP
jgi:hypothetical protein